MSHPRVPAERPNLVRAFTVWRRNALAWRKFAISSLLGNLIDPMIMLFGLGTGLGTLITNVEGKAYLVFLVPGMITFTTMNSASFEALYSAFARMQIQKTWEAILNTPLSLEDILLGELLWAASKSWMAGAAIVLVTTLAGYCSARMLWALLPVIFLVGITFAALGLIMTALARTYDFFMYWFTLFITPMGLLSGVFFPLSTLPELIRTLALALPLAQAISLVRPLAEGHAPEHALASILYLTILSAAAFTLALRLFRRRLLG